MSQATQPYLYHNNQPFSPLAQEADLIRNQNYINGLWVSSSESYPVTNPATQKVLTHVAKAGEIETKQAITAAHTAFTTWSQLTAKERSNILQKWSTLMLTHQDALAELLTQEQGKPLAESKGEVVYAASFLQWFSEEAKRIYGDIIPSHRPDAQVLVTKEPVGVVAAITPWNFPLAMVTRKVGPALAAGCTLVLKPSEETPLSAFALASLAERAGVPKGVFNIVSGEASLIGKTIMDSNLVRKISFTGSTRTGKLLMEQAAKTLKKVSLELGGNAPFIVFDDADLDQAIHAAIASKFRNTGQTCVCANRFYIQESIYPLFTTKLAEAVRKLEVGPGEENLDQGPLINESALEKVEAHVADALAHGAVVLCGGKTASLGGTFYEPTVLTNLPHNCRISQEETFGPVAACFKFSTEEEVIHLANKTLSGLSAYLCTNDYKRIWRLSQALEVGMVGINEGIISTEIAPFGGVKESGLGREGSYYGIEDYIEVKYILMGGMNSL